MLTLNGRPFTEGQAPYVDVDPDRNTHKQAIYVEVILNVGVEIRVYAMVDTGAPWSIFNTELAQELGLMTDNGEEMTLVTPYGPFSGTIQRVQIHLKATQGTSLDIDTSVFVPDENWHFGNFLGYSGFLERFRFAIDPSTYLFYFGKYDVE